MNNVASLPILFFLLVMSGCMADQPEPSFEGEVDVVPLRFANPLMMPLVINESVTPGNVTLVVVDKENCFFEDHNPQPRLYYKVFDRAGLVHEEVVAIDPEAPSESFPIPLPGRSPWLVMGNAYPCHNVFRSYIGSVASGYQLDLEHGFDHNLAVEYGVASVVLGVGESEGRATWESDRYTWRLEHLSPNTRSDGRFAGYIRVESPFGELVVQHNYTLMGGRSGYGVGAVHLVPGPYVVDVWAAVPMRETMEFQVVFKHLRIHDAACDHGFEWPDLCS